MIIALTGYCRGSRRMVKAPLSPSLVTLHLPDDRTYRGLRELGKRRVCSDATPIRGVHAVLLVLDQRALKDFVGDPGRSSIYTRLSTRPLIVR